MRGRACLLALAAVACAGAEGETVLEVSTWADPVEMSIEESYVYGFERAHPGVKLRLEGVSNLAEYRERVLTSIAAGAPPDVMLLDGIDVPAFVDRRVLLDLRPYARRLGLDLSRYDSTVLAPFRRGDAVYALPKGYTPMVLAYNKDLFDAAGLPYPSDDWTWDDFRRVAKALTLDTDGDGDVDQWGTYFDRRVLVWIPWIWSGGGDVLCPDGRSATGCLDSPETKAAFDFLLGWALRDSIVPRLFSLRRSQGDNIRLFASGKVAMFTTGHFWIPNLAALARDRRLRMGFVQIPHRAGVRPATVIYASGFAVAMNAPHRRLSVELAAYMADSLAQVTRAERGLEIPALTSVGERLALADSNDWEAVFRRATATGRPPWGARIERWREVEAMLPDLIDRVILGHEPLESAAAAVARRIDLLLGVP